MSVRYVPSLVGVSRDDESYYNLKQYFKVSALSHDGLIEGLMCYGYTEGQNREPFEFKVFDYELGLPGWASEQLVKRVHDSPHSAGRSLFEGSVERDGLKSSPVSLEASNAWFSISRSDRGGVYELRPLFDENGLSAIIGGAATYRENPPKSHRFEVIQPGVSVQFEAGLGKSIDLYDAIAILERMSRREQLKEQVQVALREHGDIVKELETL